MVKQPPVIFDDDNPEWTKEDFARAAPFEQAPAHMQAAFQKSKGGRPKGLSKEQVAPRIDKDVFGEVSRGRAGLADTHQRGFASSGGLGDMLKRLWNWQTDSLWVWIPLWLFGLALWGGFLI